MPGRPHSATVVDDATAALVTRALEGRFDADLYVSRRSPAIGAWPGPPLREALIADVKRAADIPGSAVIFEVLDALVDASESARHRAQIVGVHYGGHGTDGALMLEDGDGDLGEAFAEGLALALDDLPGLHFVFLNACETSSLVEAVHARVDVPVIATDGAIADDVAARFAARFYAALGTGSPLEVAYRKAEAEFRLKMPSPGHALREDVRFGRPRRSPRGEPGWPWRLVPPPRDDGRKVRWSLGDR